MGVTRYYTRLFSALFMLTTCDYADYVDYTCVTGLSSTT